MKKYNKKGISLIVLIITIIVMIILAAAIILSISNSGIMDKANKAKTDSDIAAIKEIISVYEAESAFNDERITLESVASKLEENGVKTQKATNTSTIVKSISLDKTSIKMSPNQTDEITVTVEQEESNKERLYAIIGDKYYEIYKSDNGNMEISKEATELDNQKLKIEVEGANYVTTSINQDTKKITITSGTNEGTDSLNIKYGEKSISCSVNVKNKILIHFVVYDEEDDITYNLTAEEGWTWQEFVESEYNDGTFEAISNPPAPSYVPRPEPIWKGPGMTGGICVLSDVLEDNVTYYVNDM